MIISRFRRFLHVIANCYGRTRPAVLLGIILSLALVLVGCGSGGSGGSSNGNGNGNGNNGGGTPLPSPTADPLLTSSEAEDSVKLDVADPIDKVYAIAVVSDAIIDDTTRGSFTIALDGGAQDKRLRNLCSSPLASDSTLSAALSAFLVCDSANVWLFLPGDDGDDLPDGLPANFAINGAVGSLSYPAAGGATSDLERIITYSLDVTAPDDAVWSLHAAEIDFPRLPTNIQTRLRSAAEGGPSETGAGDYLIYDPVPETYSIRHDVADARASNPNIYDIEGTVISNFAFDRIPDCGSERTRLLSLTPPERGDTVSPTRPESDTSDTLYCVNTRLGAFTGDSGVSDSAQFTFHPDEAFPEE